MGEDPIIVKPGVYTASDGSGTTLKGICFVFDDDSWTITPDSEVAGGILIKIPPKPRRKWVVVNDITPPPPGDPTATEKKKVALVREEGILAGVNNPVGGDIKISFTVPQTGGGPGPA